MNIIALTGNETRHTYFRVKLGLDPRFRILKTYCEGTEKSLEARTLQNHMASPLEFAHVQARTQSEKDFFSDLLEAAPDHSRPAVIPKGDINSEAVVSEIEHLEPDLVICYGSSLIRSRLLKVFHGRFLNVHLGLSPYYRGSGTNVWPIVNGEPQMVGLTFMHIDEGIDTGRIIHQVPASIYAGDSSHSIGNRLIKTMTHTYADIIANFESLTQEDQPTADGTLYMQKDWDTSACERLYEAIRSGVIERVAISDTTAPQNLVRNQGLEASLCAR